MEQSEALREAFDRVGGSIEETAARNPIVGWMRSISRKEELATFPPGSRLLEIGCGSGADAVNFALNGRTVVAVDVSPEMVSVARNRANSAGVGDLVRIARGRLDDLAAALGQMDGFPVDGAYANFSLTYEPSLRPVARMVYSLLRPGGRFLFTLPNKLCVAEAVALGSRLRLGQAARRWREPRWGVVEGVRVRSVAYTPFRVPKLLAGFFRLRRRIGVPVFMPPPHLYSPRIEAGRRILEGFDRSLATRFPWKLFGDTTLFDFERLPNG